MKQIFLSLSLLTALSACATLTADSDQLITVSTTPPGANCMLSNSDGSWAIEKTPGSVMVDRSFDPLDISCTLTGVGSAQTRIGSHTRGRAYGNILLLGIPAVVDAQTGTGYEYERDSVHLDLTRPAGQ